MNEFKNPDYPDVVIAANRLNMVSALIANIRECLVDDTLASCSAHLEATIQYVDEARQQLNHVRATAYQRLQAISPPTPEFSAHGVIVKDGAEAYDWPVGSVPPESTDVP